MADSKKPFDFRSLSPKANKKPDFSPADFELDVGRRVLPSPQPAATAEAPVAKQEEKPSAAAKPAKKARAAKPEKPSPAGEGGQGPKVVVMGRSGEAGGRPTFKAPNTECVKVTLLLPLATKRMMQKALAGDFYGKYRSNVELVDAAIRAFIADGVK